MAFMKGPSGRSVAGATVAGAAAAAVILSRLSTLSLWNDEGFTAQMVKLPWTTMLSELTRIDYNMSLHYVILKAWSALWGTSEASLRLLSGLFVLASLPLLYRLARRFAGQWVATVSVILLALNPFVLGLALTARPFAMVLFWSVVATSVLVEALEAGTRRWWLWYGVVAVAGLHIQLLAALVVAAHGVFALIHQRRIHRFNLEAVGIIALFGFVPTLIFLGPSDTLAWIGPFAIGKAAKVALAVAGGGFLAIGTIALAGLGLIRPPASENRLRWLPAVWLLVPVLIVLILAPIQSLLDDPYFAVISPALAMLAALALDRLLTPRPSWAVAVALMASGIAVVLALAGGTIGKQEGWRELTPLMIGRVQPGDAVAFPYAQYRLVAEYYAVDPGEGPYPPGEPVLPTDPWGTMSPFQLDSLRRTNGQGTHDIFEPQLLSYERIWVVWRGHLVEQEVLWDLDSHGYQVQEVVDTSGGVEAVLYTRG